MFVSCSKIPWPHMHGSWFLSRTSLEVASRPPGLHPQIRICLLSFNAINNTSALQPPQPHTTTVLRPFFWDHPGEPVPEENFWTLWCKGRLTETDTATIRMGNTPSGLTSAHLHHLPHFLQAGCPSCCPTNSIKAPKATSVFGLGRRC